jgi:transcriptional regulator with XRE-family HTH domain
MTGPELKAIRKGLGWTQPQLAHFLDLPKRWGFTPRRRGALSAHGT